MIGEEDIIVADDTGTLENKKDLQEQLLPANINEQRTITTSSNNNNLITNEFQTAIGGDLVVGVPVI